jgi:hypothetical protein
LNNDEHETNGLGERLDPKLGFPTLRLNPQWMQTADGQTITPRLIVWNNNLDRTQVDPKQFTDAETQTSSHDSRYGGDFWDGWFDMIDPDTGERMPTMNGSRMTTRDPKTWTS